MAVRELYDVIIVGAGVEGSSAAYHIAKQGAERVLLLEQFSAQNDYGSSRGGSRITRRYYHTDYYTKMMSDAYQLWTDLENEGSVKLFTKTGGMAFGKKGGKELSSVLKVAKSCNIPHKLMTASEANRIVPQLNIPGDYLCVLEEDGGIINARSAIKVLQNLFCKNGGTILDHCKVTEVVPNHTVTVITEKGTFMANKIVLTAGPWTSSLTQSLGLNLPLQVIRTEFPYWAVDKDQLDVHQQSFPNFRVFPDDSYVHFYGIRAHEHPGLCKIGLIDGPVVEQSQLKDSSSPPYTVERVAEFIGQCLKGISTSPTIVEQCLLTMTPDEDFILDFHPQYHNVVIGAGFSGIKLKLNEEAAASAAVFYHTFYSSMTKENYDPNLVVMAALNLAAKVQEVPAKLSDVVNTCHRCLHQEGPPLEVGELYWQLKDSVARYELLLLRTLKFRLNVELPHKYLLHYLLALTRWIEEGVWQRSHVTTVAWALLQDSFHTTLCLQHPPTVIATAVLYLAMHCCKLEVPGSRVADRQWWEVFSPGTSEQELQGIAENIMQVHTLKSASDKQR